MNTRTPPLPGTQAVARAIAVLKAFTDARPQMTLAEVSRAVKLNKATVYRLLSALEIEGLIAREVEAYRLGPEAIALGWRALRANDLRAVSHAELERLARETGETATLEVLRDNQVLILDESLGRHRVGSTHAIGTRWPAHVTSTGKVLLAHLPEAKREAALRARLAKVAPKTMTSAEALRRELARIRERGYATAVEELEAGYVAIGAPVFNHAGEVAAAVSVGGSSARLTADRIPGMAALVKAAAGRISQRLGFKPAG